MGKKLIFYSDDVHSLFKQKDTLQLKAHNQTIYMTNRLTELLLEQNETLKKHILKMDCFQDGIIKLLIKKENYYKGIIEKLKTQLELYECAQTNFMDQLFREVNDHKEVWTELLDRRLKMMEDKNQHQELWLNQVASQINENQQYQEQWQNQITDTINENQQHHENWMESLASQLNDLKDADKGAVNNFLKQLRTGENIEFVFINGKEEEVAAFVDFDQETNLAMFVKNNGDVLIIDCSKIDAVTR